SVDTHYDPGRIMGTCCGEAWHHRVQTGCGSRKSIRRSITTVPVNPIPVKGDDTAHSATCELHPRRSRLRPFHSLSERTRRPSNGSPSRLSGERTTEESQAIPEEETSALQAARRSYRWCRPPTSGNATIRPVSGPCTGLGTGASFCSPRCVRLR